MTARDRRPGLGLWRLAPSPRVRSAIAAAAGLVAFAIVIWLAVKVVPEELAATHGINDASKRAEEIGRTRTAVLALLAGALAAVGAWYTHRTYVLNRATLELSREAQRDTLELNRQSQITERFTRAVDQLGNTSLDIRLGGIYALERIARESPDDHGPIVEILTAFIREHTKCGQDEDEADTEESSVPARVATDVQAGLTVLGRRTVAHDPPDPWRVELNGARLAGARLTGAQLQGAHFAGAHLQLADLQGAHLQGVHLDRAHLEHANLYGAHLEGASFARAHLEEAVLEDAFLQRADLAYARLDEANLHGAHFQRAKLRSARLDGAFLEGAHLEGANLRRASLEGASLDGVTWSEETEWPDGFTPSKWPLAEMRRRDDRSADSSAGDDG